MITASRLLFVIGLIISILLPADIPDAHAQTTNLVRNGTFESGNLSLWDVCGGVRLANLQAGATAQEVHEGNYALRLGNPTRRECDGGEFFAPQLQARYNGIVVPNNASGLTLSFWYNRVGPFGEGSASWAMTVLLVTEEGEPLVRIRDYIFPDVTSGWNLARYELSADELAQARGRTFYLYFDVPFSMSEEADLAYYIDEIEVVPMRVRTPTDGATPPALQDTNTQPLVGLGVANGKLRTVRADLNGSDIRALYAGANDHGGTIARWSPDGSRIAVAEDTLQDEPGQPISINSAQISTLTFMDGQGNNQREVYHTVGKRLTPGSPPGCRPPRTDCARYDDPALDDVIADFDWSPDGQSIALNFCAWSRYADGYQTDALCRIQILDLRTNKLGPEIKPALGVTWSKQNRILYRVGPIGPLLYGIDQGIYEVDLNTTPNTKRLLFSHREPIPEDSGVRWAPNGEQFVTARFVKGFHFDDEGTQRLNYALMVFDREQPDTPRQLVLVDFGRSISSPTWSPDGRYILYNVEIGDEGQETWWVDVKSGQTKLLTGDIINVDWRPDLATFFTERVYLPAVRR